MQFFIFNEFAVEKRNHNIAQRNQISGQIKLLNSTFSLDFINCPITFDPVRSERIVDWRPLKVLRVALKLR